jgi:uncharacterized repeat protein (TIGR04052 family)
MIAIAALLAGCGGGSSTPALVNSLSGVVADGYIGGAAVCLDSNNNGVCDAGEPTGAVTTSNGAYTITGFATGDDTKYPVVVQIPSTAVDSDFPASTVGQAFTLTAPVGKTFVSPLTTLVQQKVLAGNMLAAADAAILLQLGVASGVASSVSALDNYMALQASPTAPQTTDLHARAHAAAQVVATVFKQGKANLSSTNPATDHATQQVLADQALAALQLQNPGNSASATFSTNGVATSGVPAGGPLKAAIAAQNVPAAAAATQLITLNFDLYNGATPVGSTGCDAPLTLGTASTSGTLSAAKFYVSNVALVDSNGGYSPLRLVENANQGRNVALLNFENGLGTCAASTAKPYKAVVGYVTPAPSGTTYVGVAFAVGVPQFSNYDNSYTFPIALLNHSDPTATSPASSAPATPLPLQDIGMAWSWQSGRKFSRIEFVASAVPPATSGVLTMVHLGSTGCMANPSAAGTVVTPCAGPNRVPVTFTTGFNASTNKIALDLGSLFGGLDLSTSKTWMSGRVAGMMAASPVYYYDKYQLDIKTGLPINGGITATTANPLFLIK